MKLGDRKLKILKIIIDDYVNTGLPVCSSKISKEPNMSVSSATIRNEMADLENLGLLFQPHTSAGRIPSDVGYRYYVDLISKEKNYYKNNNLILQSLILSNEIEIEEIIKEALKQLTEMTGLTSIISLPLFKKSKLKNMKLIRVNDSKVLLIMVSDSGVVKNITLPISNLSQKILDLISESLLSLFIDTQIESINVKKIYNLKNIDELSKYNDVVDYLIPILRNSLKEIENFELYVDGVNKIFDMKEFSDVVRAKKFLDLINDKNLLFEILKEANDGIIVKIGKENKFDELQNLTLVASSYKFNGVNDGRIGIIAPTRIPYEDVIDSIKIVSNTLSNIFSGISL